ncbi:hypothetical protein BDQ17DRAFT_1375323 [Cyathus striatus]|nr:hypothetical protein BDQ17DRAFT_1375323 [Cyathus striatus]
MRHLDRFTKDPLCISELFHSFPQNLMPTTLKIRVPRWIDIQGPSSDVFWSIWESVTTLDLAYIYDDCSYADPDPRYVPCTVLETISQQCKSIYYLRISLSDEDISRSSKGFPVGFENRGLQMLDLSNSRIYNPTAVSCYLRKIFPELKQIVHLDPVVHRTFQL